MCLLSHLLYPVFTSFIFFLFFSFPVLRHLIISPTSICFLSIASHVLTSLFSPLLYPSSPLPLDTAENSLTALVSSSLSWAFAVMAGQGMDVGKHRPLPLSVISW